MDKTRVRPSVTPRAGLAQGGGVVGVAVPTLAPGARLVRSRESLSLDAEASPNQDGVHEGGLVWRREEVSLGSQYRHWLLGPSLPMCSHFHCVVTSGWSFAVCVHLESEMPHSIHLCQRVFVIPFFGVMLSLHIVFHDSGYMFGLSLTAWVLFIP